MTKEATLISFKDLMQAKMEREEREAESTSLPDVSEEILNSAPENNNSLNSNDQQNILPYLGNKNIEIPTYLPIYPPTNLPTYPPVLICIQFPQKEILQNCQTQLKGLLKRASFRAVHWRSIFIYIL